jgi:site-specific recombinase XerD
MSVTLRKRKNKDGTTTLRLDIYHNSQRYFETLKNLKLEKPTTPLARENNKELLRQAEAIRVARAAELDANNYSLVSDAGKKTILITWMESYRDQYKKKDKRVIDGAIERFRDFLTETKNLRVTFGTLTVDLIEAFITYLNDYCEGEGAASYYSRFKKMIRAAYKKRLLKERLTDFVEVKPNSSPTERDVLFTDELRVLAQTPIQSPEIRRAALVSAMTGLSWVDTKKLKWEQVDLKNRKLQRSKRSKTKESIGTTLNDAAIKLLGEPGEPDELVFNLPGANGANKTLGKWVKRAGIDKHITWHCLRHSAGTNLAMAGVDILNIAGVLSHASLRYTKRYTRIADEMKQRSTDKLNIEL